MCTGNLSYSQVSGKKFMGALLAGKSMVGIIPRNWPRVILETPCSTCSQVVCGFVHYGWRLDPWSGAVMVEDNTYYNPPGVPQGTNLGPALICWYTIYMVCLSSINLTNLGISTCKSYLVVWEHHLLSFIEQKYHLI